MASIRELLNPLAQEDNCLEALPALEKIDSPALSVRSSPPDPAYSSDSDKDRADAWITSPRGSISPAIEPDKQCLAARATPSILELPLPIEQESIEQEDQQRSFESRKTVDSSPRCTSEESCISQETIEQPGPKVIWNRDRFLPLLADSGLIIMLTPVIVPNQPFDSPDKTSDPFEPLGRALETHHERIRHVPYAARHGITSYHAEFLSLADLVVLVVPNPDCQVELFERMRAISTYQGHIVMVCCNFNPELTDRARAAIRISTHSAAELGAAANLISRGCDEMGSGKQPTEIAVR